MNDLLIAEGLDKRYTDTHAVRGISCSVAASEFVAITGPSGSGKSTLLSLLSGLDKPTGGRVILDGTDLSALTEDQLSLMRRDKVGFVFQSFHLVPSLTALQNVVLPLVPSGKSRSELEKRGLELLERVGLSKKAGSLPGHMSGGERQRVAVARALMGKPRIVFADEPTGNLDSETGLAVLNLLLELRKEQGITLVVVTHDQEVAEKAHRILAVKDGQLVSAVGGDRG